MDERNEKPLNQQTDPFSAVKGRMNNTSTHKQFPLHQAAQNSDVEKMLELAKEQEVNGRDNFGNSPLHSAALSGHLDTVEGLLRLNANPNAVGLGGHTPLHLAAFNVREQVVGPLVKAGADLRASNNKGQTPYDLAFKNQHRRMFEKLIEAGCIKWPKKRTPYTSSLQDLAVLSEETTDKQPGQQVRKIKSSRTCIDPFEFIEPFTGFVGKLFQEGIRAGQDFVDKIDRTLEKELSV